MQSIINLTKWGLIYRNYLKECKRDFYNQLKQNGELSNHCYERQQELKQLAETIDKQLREKNPRSKTDEHIKIVQYESGIVSMVHEFVMDNIAFQLIHYVN